MRVYEREVILIEREMIKSKTKGFEEDSLKKKKQSVGAKRGT